MMTVEWRRSGGKSAAMKPQAATGYRQATPQDVKAMTQEQARAAGLAPLSHPLQWVEALAMSHEIGARTHALVVHEGCGCYACLNGRKCSKVEVWAVPVAVLERAVDGLRKKRRRA